jgi:hypothetical protein
VTLTPTLTLTLTPTKAKPKTKTLTLTLTQTQTQTQTLTLTSFDDMTLGEIAYKEITETRYTLRTPQRARTWSGLGSGLGLVNLVRVRPRPRVRRRPWVRRRPRVSA